MSRRKYLNPSRITNLRNIGRKIEQTKPSVQINDFNEMDYQKGSATGGALETVQKKMGLEIIENVEDLLQAQVGSDKKVVKSTITRLTAPGDNYGGILLKVNVTLENAENEKQEELNAVAKLIPDSEFMQQVLNTQVTCKKEIAFYEEIVPTLETFQREQGVDEIIDIFPKFYGARINLNDSDIVDGNAVLMMENLVYSGYENVNRLEGFNLATTKVILKDLATFHAVPLGLKLINPTMFEDKILPYLTDQYPHGGETPSPIQLLILEFLDDLEECRTLMPVLQQIMERPRHEKPEERKEPFLTIAHGDMWINNIMVKFENGEPVGSKFVDFQSFAFRSPAVDLFLFLWSSVQKSVLEQNLDDLVMFYHESIIEELTLLKCDTTQFSHESLMEEIRIAAKYGVPHALFMMTFVVFGKRGGISIDLGSNTLPEFGTKEDITAEAKEKVLYMIAECHRRGWLY